MQRSNSVKTNPFIPRRLNVNYAGLSKLKNQKKNKPSILWLKKKNAANIFNVIFRSANILSDVYRLVSKVIHINTTAKYIMEPWNINSYFFLKFLGQYYRRNNHSSLFHEQ